MRVVLCFAVALAVLFAGVAPALADDSFSVSAEVDRVTKKLDTESFWKGAVGASFGAWLGAEALKWGPVLTTTSDVALVSPFASIVVRSMIPLFAAAVGAQVAARGFESADWRLAGFQTLGGAVGTAIALVVAPGLGYLGPLVGDLVGSFAATKILQGFRARAAAPGANGSASATNVPAITGPAPAAPTSTSSLARDAYGRLISATRAGDPAAAKAAYADYVSAPAK